MSSEVLISIKNLCKQFNQFTAVKDLDLTVYKGDVYGFLGPNGAGKSTTIRMLMGLIHPTSGTIEIYGKHLQEERSFILSSIGAIIEKPDFYNYLSGIQNLELLNKMQPKQASRDDLYRLLELVGLKGREKSKVKTYSQGMKQRLGFAQALMHNPDLIVLDEPTNGLDPQQIAEMRSVLKRYAKGGRTVIISSHLLAEVQQTCSHVVLMHRGKLIATGTLKKILKNSQSLEEIFLELIGDDLIIGKEVK